MLSLFRTNSLVGLILVLGLAIITHLSAFFLEGTPDHLSGGVWTNWIYQVLPPYTAISNWLAIFIVFSQALQVNYLVNQYRLKDDMRNYIPAAVYVVVCSLFPEFLFLTPALLANTFVLFSMMYLFRTYKSNESATDLFDTGLYLGMASLFFAVELLLFFACLAGWLILRGSKFREIIMIMAGIFTPIFLTWTISFVGNYSTAMITEFFNPHIEFGLPALNLSFVEITKIIFWGLLLLIVLGNLNFYLLKRNIQAQKIVAILYWYLLFSGIMIIASNGLEISYLLPSAIPISVFLSLSLNASRPASAEIFFLLLLVSLLCFQVIGYNGLALI